MDVKGGSMLLKKGDEKRKGADTPFCTMSHYQSLMVYKITVFYLRKNQLNREIKL